MKQKAPQQSPITPPAWQRWFIWQCYQQQLNALINQWHILQQTKGRSRRWLHLWHSLKRAAVTALLTAALLMHQTTPIILAERTPTFGAATANPFNLADIGDNSTPTLVDIDGDGDADAFMGNNSGDITYFENTGTAVSPSFATPTTNPFNLTNVGTNTIPAFADIDRDGDLDAFIGHSSGNISYFENTGTAVSPSFAPPTTNPFGLTDIGDNSAPTFADLDRDNDLDLFSGDSNGNITYFENIGTTINPTFAAATLNPFNFTDIGDNSIPTFVDIDGDGDLDTFVGDSDGNNTFFQNNSFGNTVTFGTPTSNPFNLTDVGDNSAPTFIDIDQDGNLDAFVGDSLGNTAYFQNNGSVDAPSFGAAATNPLGLTDVGDDSNPTFADLDGDGDLDAFIGESLGDIAYFENSGTPITPTFTAPITSAFGLKNIVLASHPAFTDIDSDGDLDLFIGERFGTIKYFQNIGSSTTPSYTTPITNPFNFTDVGDNSTPAFTDIDGDGDLDAFVSESFGNIRYFQNNGTPLAPNFAAPIDNPFGLADMGNFGNITFADIGSDGDVEAFVGNGNGRVTMFYGAANNPTAVSLNSITTTPSSPIMPLLSFITLTITAIWLQIRRRHQ